MVGIMVKWYNRVFIFYFLVVLFYYYKMVVVFLDIILVF